MCLAPLGLTAVAGCGGSGSGSGSSVASVPSMVAPAAAATVSTGPGQIFALQDAAVPMIRSRPEAFTAIYATLGSATAVRAAAVRAALGPRFSALSFAGCEAVFATFVAFNVAPYGDTPLAPMDATFSQLVNSSALACGHYCKLTLLFTLLNHPYAIPPEIDPTSTVVPTIHYVVWQPNAPFELGYHSQLIMTNVLPNAYLLLDPTYALAMAIPFNSTYPQSSLTVIENAANLLQFPSPPGALVTLDPDPAPNKQIVILTLQTGVLNSSYIYHDSLFGSEGWDTRMSTIIANMG